MFNALKLPELRRRIFFTLLIITIFRLLAHIPVPGVDVASIRNFISKNAFLGLFDLFSGGGFQNFSIMTLGLGPYINASIIMQLFTAMVPKLEELSKEGESGREQINQYTRYLTVPLAILQSYGVYFLLNRQGIISSLDGFSLAVLVLTMTGGTMLATWIGELVTEYGVGNGISLLIFVGIISRLPLSAVQFFSTATADNIPNILLFLLIGIVVIVGVVLVNEGTKNITIEYGRRGNVGYNSSSYLPIKVNQAGVIPIIFAISVVLIPSLIAAPMRASSTALLQNIGSFLSTNFSSSSMAYNITYFLLVVGFTYFYTAVQFNPEKISEDIKKRGGFIKGVRPGSATTKHLSGIINRITLVGAIFLGVIAILPYIMQSFAGASSFAVGGTGLLIVVSVVLETMRQVESMMVTRNYDSFLE